MEFINW